MEKYLYGKFALQAWGIPDIHGKIEAEDAVVQAEYVVFSKDGFRSGRDTKATVHSCTIEGAKNYTTHNGACMPELAFMQVAKSYTDIELIYLGLQLVSGYRGHEPLTTVHAIEDCALELKRHHGRGSILKIAPYLCEGSRSPMETITYMLLRLPVHLGGRGFKHLQFNYEITSLVNGRTYYADLCWPEKKLIIEYQSKYHESAKQTLRDQNRKAALEAEGYQVVEVWAEDIYNLERFENLVTHLQKLTGKRIRYRSGKFILNHKRIRELLVCEGRQATTEPTALTLIKSDGLPQRSWLKKAYSLYLKYHKNLLAKFAIGYYHKNPRSHLKYT